MRNENLRAVCEDLGLRSVSTIISSGNVVFEDAAVDTTGLESTLEKAWQETLGFESTTIIRSRLELEALVEQRPFGDLEHGPGSYLLVTFSKYPLELTLDVPHRPENSSYSLVGATDRELFTVTDTSTQTPDVMTWIERQFGKQVSSRTWLTVARILKRMG